MISNGIETAVYEGSKAIFFFVGSEIQKEMGVAFQMSTTPS